MIDPQLRDTDTDICQQSCTGVSRRSVLGAAAIGVSVTALAGCSQATPPATSGSGSGAPGSGSGAPGSGSSAAGGGALASLSAIPVGEAIAAKGPDGAQIIIARPTASTVAAFSAICTHLGCVVAPAGKQLNCPCHGSVFNATTGAVINGPASRPLPPVNVKISGANVVAG